MVKFILLLPIATSVSTIIDPINQGLNITSTNYSANKEIKFDFNLSESVEMESWGSPGSRSSVSEEKEFITWKDYADSRSDFMIKYPKVELILYSKLGTNNIVDPKEIDGSVTFETIDLFSGITNRRYISSDSQKKFDFFATAQTYATGWSDRKKGYIKIGCYVEAGWNKETRMISAEIKLMSIIFKN